MPRHGLWLSIVAGAALDACLLGLSGLALARVMANFHGDFSFFLGVLATLLTLVSPLWFVHVLILPSLLGRSIPRGAPLATVLFLLIARMLILLIGGAMGLALQPALYSKDAWPSLLFSIWFGPTGAAVGASISPLRRLAWRDRSISMLRADVIGGTLGAVLLPLSFAAHRIVWEQISWPIGMNAGFGLMFAAASVGSYPHLVLSGLAFLNPLPPTSTSRIAPSAITPIALRAAVGAIRRAWLLNRDKFIELW